MTHMVTRCPKCATAFRITTTQLESAKGSVRCGSCLHIFKANDNLVSAAPTAKETEPQAQETTPEVQDLKKIVLDEQNSHADHDIDIEIDDDTLISDDMDLSKKDESSYEFEGYLDIDLRPKQTMSLFERNIQPEPETDTEDDAVDESWAEELLGEDKDLLNALENDESHKRKSSILIDDDESFTDIASHTATPNDEISNSVTIDDETESANNNGVNPQDIKRAILERHAVDVPDPSEYARINQEFSNLYKTPLFSIVNDENAEKEETSAATTSETDIAISATRDEKDLTVEQNNETSTSTFGTGFFRHRDDYHESPQTHKHPLKTQPAIHATPDSRAALLMNIAPSPIELTAQRLRSWSQKTHWFTLSVVAALLLIFQIAYFKFDELSKIEPYRTVYVWVCPLLDCKVPGLVDPTKIVAYQLILRNHPEVANALLLDVMIRNDAPFEQPFPDLILAFTTMDEKPVAARRFKPKDYLGGELAGMERIPSKQPVHITLELSDPGPEAVNYHMSIAP